MNMPPNIRVTQKQVAQAAGVSVAAVSRVLQGEENFRISPENRDKILRAAQKMGYRHNVHARTLRSGRSRLIGMINTSPFYPVLGQLMQGVEEKVVAQGYRFNFYNYFDLNPEIQREKEQQAVEYFLSVRAEGILVADYMAYTAAKSHLQDFVAARVPIVFLHLPPRMENKGISSVEVDFYRGGQLVAESLLEQGHRHFAAISDISEVGRNMRLAGYVDTIEKARQHDRSITLTTEIDIISTELGHSYAHKLLTGKRPPTAIFCYNDFVALAALKAASDLKRSVPKDVAVVGFDDLEFCSYTIPPLTSVAQPIARVVEEGIKVLFEMIEQGDDMVGVSKKFAPELRVRESSLVTR